MGRRFHWKFSVLSIAAALAIALAGCDESKAKVNQPVIVRPTTGPVGSVHGVAIFKGTPPTPTLISGRSCHLGAHDTQVTPVIVGAGGELADVVVFLKNAGGDPPAAASTPAVVLDQVDCQYVPAVLAMHTGQTLSVQSHDATLHNVHLLSDKNPAFNRGIDNGQSINVVFNLPESMQVKCDVHPWMSAAVHVFDHPYYAVTGKDGKFEIAGIPAGKQTLVFRHAYLGDEEVEVNVEEGKAAEVTGTFERK